MALFDAKNFNGEVFGAYVDKAPNLKRNELLKSGAIVEKKQYAASGLLRRWCRLSNG